MFEPTNEQREILNAFHAGRNLKIHAFAGTGKTSTLFYIASQTDRQGLYFAFNRRIANEAKKKMPSNIVAATVHSFAWKWASGNFQTEKLIQNPTHRLIRNLISPVSIPHFSEFKTAGTVLRTVGTFCQSGDYDIDTNHLPWDHEAYIFDKEILERHQNDFVGAAKRVWEEMRRPDGEIPLGHDGYLKLWSLSQPKLEFDFLFIDEAQDLNPVMLQILECFPGQKVVVGDCQQQIYEWRGATNAMEYGFEAQDLFLTKTFRFGEELAGVANKVLRSLKVKKSIVSASGTGTVVTTGLENDPNAILFRKNATLIQNAVDRFRGGDKFHIVDPNKNIAHSVEDYFRLNDGHWGKSSTFEGFNSWETVVSLAQKEQDNPFRGYVELFKKNDPLEVKEAVNASEKRPANSYPSLSTIHQAKGLEWPAVQLAGDFRFDLHSKSFDQLEEELRLLYVALTRAEQTLALPESLLKFCNSELGEKPERYAVIDLETTGLSPSQGDRITEVGIVLVENGEIVERFQSFVNPNRPIPSDVQKLTGITDEMVANAPSSSVVLAQAMEFIGDRPLIAHNASFEHRFLSNELCEISTENNVNLLCTMLLSRRVFPNLKSYKLGNLVSQFQLPKGQAHRALSDAEMTAHLLFRLERRVVEAAPAGFEFSADSFLRLSKSQPKLFRELGLTEAIITSEKRFAKAMYDRGTFFVVKSQKRVKAVTACPHSQPKTATKPKPKLVSSPQAITPEPSSASPRPNPVAEKARSVVRKVLLTLNWLVFGLFPAASLLLLLQPDYPDKGFVVVISALSLLLGWGGHRLVARVLRNKNLQSNEAPLELERFSE